jgi:hypothetical protein
MTLAELLKELKGIDPETADDIGDIVNVISIKSDGSFTLDAYYPDFIIQGSIQQACERRGWTWCIYKQTPEEKKSHCAEISKITPGYDGDCYNQYHESCIAGKEADTAAEALLAAYILAAYIAAVKEEKRSTALAEE